MFLKVLKFEFKQICFESSFDRNLSFVAPFALFFFLQMEALDLNFLKRPNLPNFGIVRNYFMLQELITCFRSFSRSFLRFFLHDCLCVVTIACS